jgi:hypothetical protein
MSLSVAASVVRSMTETRIESRLNGISRMSVIPPSEIMSLPTVSNVNAKPSVEILPVEIITEFGFRPQKRIPVRPDFQVS